MLKQIPVESQSIWQSILNRIGVYDTYHTADYHRIEVGKDEKPILFYLAEGESCVALPLIIRPIPGHHLMDATSVYGYTGSLVHHGNAKVFVHFRRQLEAMLRQMKVVSVFSRLHPLIDDTALLTGLGEVVDSGKTVSINLSEGQEEQYGHYRKGHKYTIKKLKKLGVACREVSWTEYGLDFMQIYEATMARIGATPNYFFPISYYESLFSSKDFRSHLFCCFLEGKVIAASIFMECQGVLQYHLSGTVSEALPLSPNTLILDTVRRWGSERGCRVLHLGGGIGGREDSLFKFKVGFSDQWHTFKTWRWVVMPELYTTLSAGPDEAAQPYFPAYRRPGTPLNLIQEGNS